MAEAKAQSEWAHTSALMALFANAHRDPKKTRAFTPSDFKPLQARGRRQIDGRTRDLRILRDVFVKREGRKG